jgi:hypothetical protein
MRKPDPYALLWADICAERAREAAIKRAIERRDRERAEREARRKAAIIAHYNLAAIERGDKAVH